MKKITKSIYNALVVLLIMSLFACGKPAPIILDDINAVTLDNWISIKFENEDKSDEIKDIVVSLEDEVIETTFKTTDNVVVDLRSKDGFLPKSNYLLTATYTSGKSYQVILNTLSRREQVLFDIRENFFIMPAEGDYDIDEAEKMKDRILNISPKILLSMYKAGVRMKLANGPITNEPELQYLQGEVPRGWEYTGMTWDDVPGAGGYDLPIARIGYSDPSFENNHDTINLELHELAHTVDNYITGRVEDALSFSDEFIDVWEQEVHSVLPYDYFIDYPEEYFAEAFAMYYLSEDSKNELRTLAPKTYDFIDTLDIYTQIEDFD